MTAGEIRALAVQAGVGPGVTVLDLCCGIAGPGRFLTRELGCDYLGVDASASAVAIARERASDLACRFAVAQIPPLPAGPFDVVLLLETMLAFEDKEALVREIGAALRPGGRFAFTLEEGSPLTAAERAAMPDADTVWLTPLDELATSLDQAGLVVTWQEDHSRAHRATARRWRTRSPRTQRPSPRRSAAARSTSCSPPTICGSSGWMRGGCGSSRWWRSGPRTRPRARRRAARSCGARRRSGASSHPGREASR